MWQEKPVRKLPMSQAFVRRTDSQKHGGMSLEKDNAMFIFLNEKS